MKVRVYLMVLVLGLIISCNDVSNMVRKISGGKSDIPIIDTVLYSQSTEVLFQDTMIDIGTIKEGGEYRIVYKYQNVGNVPLMLFQVSPSCGCTIAEFSHNPLSSGKVDSIVAKFDSKSKLGSYQKNIKVTCNSKQKNHDLYFKVNVIN